MQNRMFSCHDSFCFQVSPAFSPSGEVKPQSDVTLTVAADPGSLACVLIQDSRVRELGVDNDITRERVIKLKTNSISFSQQMRPCLTSEDSKVEY